MPRGARTRARERSSRRPGAQHRSGEGHDPVAPGGRRFEMRAAFSVLLLIALTVALAQSPGPIRFEEVTAAAGVNFSHSFGAERLGSLVESTGAGAVWFDYNNDGR